jgi:hypothetical protein
MTSSPVQTRKLTLEELLAMDFPEDGAKRELVNGEIVVVPAPSMPHKEVQSFLHELFTVFKLRHPHYKGYSELNLKLYEGHHAIADFVIARLEEHGGPCRKTRQFLEGPPDVVVEVLSPERQWRDLVEKRGEYEQGGCPSTGSSIRTSRRPCSCGSRPAATIWSGFRRARCSSPRRCRGCAWTWRRCSAATCAPASPPWVLASTWASPEARRAAL